MIPEVSVGEAVLADTLNQLIKNVNSSPGRAIFTSSGSWAVPEGIHKFRVYLCGGGGKGVTSEGEIGTIQANGGSAPLISKDFSGAEIGTTFAITIGGGGSGIGTDYPYAGGSGGTSVFGASVMISSGGGGGSLAGSGGSGSQSGADMIHGNSMFYYTYGVGFGEGGRGDSNGYPGLCVIEW